MEATAPSKPLCEGTSEVVVEHELVGTRAGLHLVDLAGALLGEMTVDHLRGEHVTLQQKGVVDASAQRFLEQARRERHLGELLGRKVVQLVIDRLAPNPRSNGVGPLLAGSNPDGLVDRHHKNLAIADLVCTRSVLNGLHSALDEGIIEYDFDLELGQEVHRVFGAPVNLGMALLATEAFDLGDSHALDPGLG